MPLIPSFAGLWKVIKHEAQHKSDWKRTCFLEAQSSTFPIITGAEFSKCQELQQANRTWEEDG